MHLILADLIHTGTEKISNGLGVQLVDVVNIISF